MSQPNAPEFDWQLRISVTASVNFTFHWGPSKHVMLPLCLRRTPERDPNIGGGRDYQNNLVICNGPGHTKFPFRSLQPTVFESPGLKVTSLNILVAIINNNALKDLLTATIYVHICLMLNDLGRGHRSEGSA